MSALALQAAGAQQPLTAPAPSPPASQPNVFALGAPPQPLDGVSVFVENGCGITRLQDVVTFGVPIDVRLGLTDLRDFIVVDPQDQPVATQWRVLVRRGGPREDVGKPIVWALLSFVADAPLGPAPVYRIVRRAGVPLRPPITVTASPDTLTVAVDDHTTIAIATEAFAPFASAVLDGVDVITRTSRGLDIAAATQGAVTHGSVLTHIRETTVEERGPVRVVVRQVLAIGGLNATVRRTFHTGSRTVVLDICLENPAADGRFHQVVPPGVVSIDHYGLRQKPAGEWPVTVTTMTGPMPLNATQVAALTQDFTGDLHALAERPMEPGFTWRALIDGVALDHGTRHQGAIDLTTTTGGFTVVVPRFWENFPKAFAVDANGLAIGLLPPFGYGIDPGGADFARAETRAGSAGVPVGHRLEGGRWKTDRIVFTFHGPGAPSMQDLGAAAARAKLPLTGHLAPEVARATGATSTLWMERRPTANDRIAARFEQFTNIVVDDAAADPLPRIGKIGLPAWTERGGTNGGRQSFGWDRFGDIPWGDGYCSLHYDWPQTILTQWLRTGDRQLLDRGLIMAAFRRDLGTNHTTDKRENWRGAQIYEKGFFHGNEMSGQISHHWIRGLFLAYALTGDEGALASANMGLEFALSAYRAPSEWAGLYGARVPGWPIDALVDGWLYTGNPRYLAEARRGVARCDEVEAKDGLHGYVLDKAENSDTKPWMEAILQVAVARYALVSGDHAFDAMLARRAAFLADEAVVGTDDGRGTIPFAWTIWTPKGGSQPAIHHLWQISEALAYTSLALADDAPRAAALRARAIELFDVACRYWQIEPGAPQANGLVAPAAWSPVTFAPNMFPGSESKVIGNLLRQGQATFALRGLTK